LGRLDRYILREVATSWAAVTVVLLFILVGNQVAQVLGQAAEYRYPHAVVGILILLTSIQNLSVVLPVGLLLGIMLALGRLYHESEMAAIRACGIGPLQLMRPVMLLAALVTLVLAWLTLVLAPRAFGEAQQIRRDALRAAQFGVLVPGRFHSFAGGTGVFYAEAAGPDGDLYKVFVERRVADHLEIALAARASHRSEEGGLLQVITLYDGERYEGTPGLARLRRMEFREHGIPIRLGDPAAGPARVETTPTSRLAASRDVGDIAEFQWRLSMPAMAFLLALLAVPLAELRPREGRYARVGYAILIYFIYVNLLTAARSWLEKGSLAPLPGLWWPHVALLVTALALLVRQTHPSAFRLARR
jgi:lipopolysaccharide export system permease protein